MTLRCSSVAVLHQLQLHISTETRLLFFPHLNGSYFHIMMPDYHDAILSCTVKLNVKPHIMHALRVSACSYYNCYNISCGTWCASERVPTDVAVNLLTMRDCDSKAKKEAVLSAAVLA